MMDVATATAPEWQPLDTAPKNKKCLLLTKFGIALTGVWAPSTADGYVAWAPLPKRPEWLRSLMMRNV